jgi:hypothetical protein
LQEVAVVVLETMKDGKKERGRKEDGGQMKGKERRRLRI